MLLSKATYSTFRLYIFFIMCVSWESNPQPFALQTQCSTTEPQEHNMHKCIVHCKSNQIKSNHFYCHITSALVSEILMSVLQTVQKNNRQFTYGQTVQKTALEHLQCSRQCKKNNNSNLHMDSTYLQTVQKTMCKIHIHILSTHSVL